MRVMGEVSRMALRYAPRLALGAYSGTDLCCESSLRFAQTVNFHFDGPRVNPERTLTEGKREPTYWWLASPSTLSSGPGIPSGWLEFSSAKTLMPLLTEATSR